MLCNKDVIIIIISVNFIIKQLFNILGVEYKIIPITQSKIHYDIMKIGGREFIS